MIVYPPLGFHFVVRIESLTYRGLPDIGFQSASGISASVGVEEYKEGGENRYAHKLPNPVTYPNLVLKRGMLVGSQLMQWFKDSVENYTYEPHNIILILQSRELLPLQAWNFINAWPVKWTVEGFNAESNSIVVENIEFAYQYFRRIDLTSL